MATHMNRVCCTGRVRVRALSAATLTRSTISRPSAMQVARAGSALGCCSARLTESMADRDRLARSDAAAGSCPALRAGFTQGFRPTRIPRGDCHPSPVCDAAGSGGAVDGDELMA